MTIERLHLSNFEKHADTTIDFHPGINVILGENDQGKSSILRAAVLVALNRPQGDEYVDDLTKECSVTMKCKDAPAVTRSRKGDKNKYSIESEGGPIVLEAFRAAVPDEVRKILDIGTVNIQEQFQKYYLLQEVPGQAAKILHELFGLDLVDKTISVSNNAIRSQGSTLKSRKAQLENIQLDIAKYDYVEEFKEELAALETDIKNYEELTERGRLLTNQLDRWETIQQEIDKIKAPAGLQKRAVDLSDLIQECISLKEKKDKLFYLVHGGEGAQEKIDENAELIALKKPAWQMHRDITDLQTERKKMHPLIRLIDKAKDVAECLGKAKQAVDANDWRLAKYKEEVKLCPVCNRPFPKKELHANKYKTRKKQ